MNGLYWDTIITLSLISLITPFFFRGTNNEKLAIFIAIFVNIFSFAIRILTDGTFSGYLLNQQIDIETWKILALRTSFVCASSSLFLLLPINRLFIKIPENLIYYLEKIFNVFINKIPFKFFMVFNSLALLIIYFLTITAEVKFGLLGLLRFISFWGILLLNPLVKNKYFRILNYLLLVLVAFGEGRQSIIIILGSYLITNFKFSNLKIYLPKSIKFKNLRTSFYIFTLVPLMLYLFLAKGMERSTINIFAIDFKEVLKNWTLVIKYLSMSLSTPDVYVAQYMGNYSGIFDLIKVPFIYIIKFFSIFIFDKTKSLTGPCSILTGKLTDQEAGEFSGGLCSGLVGVSDYLSNYFYPITIFYVVFALIILLITIRIFKFLPVYQSNAIILLMSYQVAWKGADIFILLISILMVFFFTKNFYKRFRLIS